MIPTNEAEQDRIFELTSKLSEVAAGFPVEMVMTAAGMLATEAIATQTRGLSVEKACALVRVMTKSMQENLRRSWADRQAGRR